MLSVLTQSIANASFGIYFPKFVGTIYELLSAPISYFEIVLGYVGAAATKSIILGLIILTPQLLNEWTHTYVSTATVLGWTLPVPDSLIHMCLFLGALTFMYISARAVDDAEYRGMFLDPLIADLHVALTARNRYRGAVTTESE